MAGDPRIRGEHYLLVQPAPEAADHPRIRGEHRRSRRPSRLAEGSSPHTRGALHGAVKALIDERIIPAYAGSTGVDRVGHRGLPGSSPHTRGAQTSGASRDGSPGIIPAYAGSTRSKSCRGAIAEDHPRIRGEHHGHVDDGVRVAGSSPHTRGARDGPERLRNVGGIIPAYAGSTKQSASKGSSRSDHPRIRGEHTVDGGCAVPGAGSSPHTRGAHTAVSHPAESGRIIPAYAGSTRGAGRRRRRFADHPRIRGEHTTAGGSPRISLGSSPHTRGALGVYDGIVEFTGIIPAYAGSTSPKGEKVGAGRDHPRIRGEHA